jgi:hypothetical protein
MKIDLDLATDAVKRASEQVDLLLYADLDAPHLDLTENAEMCLVAIQALDEARILYLRVAAEMKSKGYVNIPRLWPRTAA